jgi:hypothetical protein
VVDLCGEWAVASCLPVSGVDTDSLTCDHCDLEEVEQLASFFESSIVQTSLKKHPRHINETKLNVVKSDCLSFFAALQLTGIAPTAAAMPTTVTAVTPAAAETVDAVDLQIAPSATYDMDRLREVFAKRFLEQQGDMLSFASSLLKSAGRSVSAVAATADSNGASRNEAAERLQWLRSSPQYSIPQEFEAFARLFVRLFDRQHLYHCRTPHCGEQCLFRTAHCEHEPCQVCFSQLHQWKHEKVCPEKVVPCDRQCGVVLRRRLLPAHLTDSCLLRPVTCPFHAIGCNVPLLAQDLEVHLNENTTQHLLLALHRMQEYERVMSQLHGRVHEIDRVTAQHATELAAVGVAVAATTTALAVAEKRLDNAMHDLNNKTEKKCIAHADAIASELRGEHGRLSRSLLDLRSGSSK